MNKGIKPGIEGLLCNNYCLDRLYSSQLWIIYKISLLENQYSLYAGSICVSIAFVGNISNKITKPHWLNIDFIFEKFAMKRLYSGNISFAFEIQGQDLVKARFCKSGDPGTKISRVPQIIHFLHDNMITNLLSINISL